MGQAALRCSLSWTPAPSPAPLADGGGENDHDEAKNDDAGVGLVGVPSDIVDEH